MATNNALNVQGPTPLFKVDNNVGLSDCTGDSTVVYPIPFARVIYDTTSSYSLASNLFTAPVSGVFLMSGIVYLQFGAGSSGIDTVSFQSMINGTPDQFLHYYNANILAAYALDGLGLALPFSIQCSLTVGDTFALRVIGNNGTKTISLSSDPRLMILQGSLLFAV